MSEYLKAATDKFNSNKWVNYNLSFHDFICQCYVKLTPNSYGTCIEEKLIYDLKLDKVSASKNRGDFKWYNKYFEFKVSFYSSTTDSYSITHIRPWQNLDYYLLCFVDCTKNFTPNFYMIDKTTITQLNSGYMNGTPESNKNNVNIELRATVKYDSDNMFLIKKSNLLKDTSIESLREFLMGIKHEDDERRCDEYLDSIKERILWLHDEKSPFLKGYLENLTPDIPGLLKYFGLSHLLKCD